jgi:hypothetical protein
MEMHIDSYDGPVIAKTDIPVTDSARPAMQAGEYSIETYNGESKIYMLCLRIIQEFWRI